MNNKQLSSNIQSNLLDINQVAERVYRLNFEHDLQIRSIESTRSQDIEETQANLWWMSPPCQPFTHRGHQRDVGDTRTGSFLRVLGLIGELRPRMLAMENVPGFAQSDTANRLRGVLEGAGYTWKEFDLCPTQFGIPNRRRRFYVAASRDRRVTSPAMIVSNQRLADSIDENPSEELFVDDNLIRDYADSIHCVDRNDEVAAASCFTSAYGKSPIRSGSYLRHGDRVRRFSPREILRLMGYPESYRWPGELTTRQSWKLIGNSLSIPAVSHVLKSFVL